MIWLSLPGCLSFVLSVARQRRRSSLSDNRPHPPAKQADFVVIAPQFAEEKGV
jgi:hypothetical protein